MERGRSRDDGVVLKKGPWTGEEDEILLEYVRKNGPRDWSSIRSKSLLPRSGKSCRLRWVNKLKPDLKTGCKFSAEEERTVIDLQAKFGNKWARIATYLPGRTDNDVKNFWSTRRKRLARMLRAAQPQKRPQRNPEKLPILVEASSPEDPSPYILYSSPNNGDCSKVDPINQIGSTIQTTLHQNKPNYEPHCTTTTTNHPLCPQFNFPELPQTLLDLPLIPEGYDLGFDPSFPDPFLDSDVGLGLELLGFPMNCLEGGSCNYNNIMMDDLKIPNTPESFLDDFPVDMLDPPPPPPPPSNSDG